MTGKTLPITGSCQWGAVRYESTEPPIRVAYCHCRNCQRACGNLIAIMAAFPPMARMATGSASATMAIAPKTGGGVTTALSRLHHAQNPN